MTANNQRRSVSTQPGAPALVEFKNFKFLIVNKPNQASLPVFVKVKFNACSSVCMCVCVAAAVSEDKHNSGCWFLMVFNNNPCPIVSMRAG